MLRSLPLILICLALAEGSMAEDKSGPAFYLPANAQYTIVDSALDSVRFTLDKTVRRDDRGHLVSISSFVDPDGNVMGWHDFGNLEAIRIPEAVSLPICSIGRFPRAAHSAEW